MIKIDRSTLLTELIKFSQDGSGLVVGNPGVGKSYLLSQLKTHYLDSGVVSFLIKIDNLREATDEAIQDELGLGEPWIETFQKIEVTDGKKALLIFDRFDAARNEDFRKAILAQIKKANRKLAPKWNVLVSARTHDAEKSQQLIQMFPLSDDNTDFRNCRQHIIHLLTPDELKASM